MSEVESINAKLRENKGKGVARALRREGRTPAIVYGEGIEPIAISLDYRELNSHMRKSGFTNRLCNIIIDKKNLSVLPQAIEKNPVTEMVEHIDFLKVGDKTKVTVEVPVIFINESESPGLKRGGVLNVVRHSVEVSCPVQKIPEKFEFDLTGLEVGDSVHISAINLEEGVLTTISDRDFTVASLVAPSALVSATADEETSEEEEGEEEQTDDKEEKSETSKEDS